MDKLHSHNLLSQVTSKGQILVRSQGHFPLSQNFQLEIPAEKRNKQKGFFFPFFPTCNLIGRSKNLGDDQEDNKME